MPSFQNYKHQWLDGSDVALPSGKVVCVGRNYAEHAKELNNPIPTEPLLFMKPATSLVDFTNPVLIPKGFGTVHYEAEISVLIGKRLSVCTDADVALDSVTGVGAALDLTLRDLQSDLKSKGQPWEKAKAFDGACPVSPFVSTAMIPDFEDIKISLKIDEALVQSGSSEEMLTGVSDLLCYISTFFTLEPGDIVLTGTPKGVGAITEGRKLTLGLADQFEWCSLTQ